MTERRGRGTQDAHPADNDNDDLQSQVDAVADVLYGLPPDEFSPTRDQYIRQAREQHNQALARELARLRKPTQSAWLINLLWRDQREVIEQLFELATELSEAQAEAAGPVLRELTAQRRQLESALMRQAVALAEQQGVRVSDTTAREAQETLSAALALPEVADEVRSGHLVKPASYAGFGAPPAPGTPRPAHPRPPIDLAAIQRQRAAQAERRPARAEPAEDEQTKAEEEAAARRAREEEEERRRAAERRLDEARGAASAAEHELDRASRGLAAAEQRQADLQQQLETLREHLRRVEADIAEAEGATNRAQQERDRAEEARLKARQAVAEAERELRR